MQGLGGFPGVKGFKGQKGDFSVVDFKGELERIETYSTPNSRIMMSRPLIGHLSPGEKGNRGQSGPLGQQGFLGRRGLDGPQGGPGNPGPEVSQGEFTVRLRTPWKTNKTLI